MSTPAHVVLIGPVLPFRGGIAQHTTMLHRALSQRTTVQTISFSRQYPKFLFPGKSDRDPTYLNYREPDVHYLIDSVNPLSWKRTINALATAPGCTVILPWWTVYWTFCFLYLTLTLRKKGCRILFFCHNVVEHETAFWKRFLTKQVLRHGDMFMVHTHEDKNNLLNLLPGAIVRVHPHPIYDHFPAPHGTLRRQGDLELLFFGFIRPYKGLDILVEAMGLLRGKNIHLTIAGEFWGGQEETERRIHDLGIEAQIDVVAQYINEQETAEYFSRADIVVLPYKSATGSGVVPIAYHYGKPVIVTPVGGLKDVVVDGKTGFFVEVGSATSLADKIQLLTSDGLAKMKPDIDDFKARFSWASMAKDILESMNCP